MMHLMFGGQAAAEAPPAGPACAYQATYVLVNDGSLLGASNWPNFSAGAQAMSFDDGDADAAYGAVPDFGQPGNGVLPMGPDVWPVFELGITMPAAPSGGLIALGVMVVSSDSAVVQGVKITRNNTNAALLATVLSGSYGQVHDSTAMTDFRLGLYINGDTGQLGYMLDGVDQGYFTGAPFAGKTGVILAPIGDNLSDAFTGTAQIELITDPADMLMVPPCNV